MLSFLIYLAILQDALVELFGHVLASIYFWLDMDYASSSDQRNRFESKTLCTVAYHNSATLDKYMHCVNFLFRWTRRMPWFGNGLVWFGRMSSNTLPVPISPALHIGCIRRVVTGVTALNLSR